MLEENNVGSYVEQAPATAKLEKLFFQFLQK